MKYVSNLKGKVTDVQIPVKDWQKIEQKLAAFHIVESIKSGYAEMRQIENGELKGKTLEEFLDKF